MTWVTLTESDVKVALNAAELETYRNQVANGDSDPLSTIIADVTAEVRGYVATRYPLEADGLPHSLKNAALDLAVYRLAKRCQSTTQEQRKPAADDAMSLLRDVAAGEVAIASGTEGGSGGAAWGGRDRFYADEQP